MSSPRTIVVFGSGPGIGRSVAQEFANNGFNHVILLARQNSNLQQDKMAIEKNTKDVKIDTLIVDLADKASLQEAFDKLDTLTQNIECLVYNGARVAPSALMEFPVEEMELDFKVYLRTRVCLPTEFEKLNLNRQQTRDSTLYHSGAFQSSWLLQSRILTQSPPCS